MLTISTMAYNQLEYTQMCLESVLEYTPKPYHLRLVDNGSTDGTLFYFEEIAGRHKDTEIIHYDQNEIVEKITNEILDGEQNPYLIGVTNDTIVCKGWSDRLIACLTSADDIGMVGPRANCISGKQKAYPGAYRTIEEYQDVADRWAKDHKGEYFEVDRVVGMLAAIRMSAYRATEGYDSNLPTNGENGAYGFSDDDLSQKMRRAGYRLMIANDVFIHHFGSVTVGESAKRGIYKNAILYKERDV